MISIGSIEGINLKDGAEKEICAKVTSSDNHSLISHTLLLATLRYYLSKLFIHTHLVNLECDLPQSVNQQHAAVVDSLNRSPSPFT